MKTTVNYPLNNRKIETHILAKIPYNFASKHNIIPVEYNETLNELTIVMSDICDIEILDDIKRISGCRILARSGSEDEISEVIRKFYLNETEKNTTVTDASPDFDVSTIDIVDDIINTAIRERASDIHVEAYDNSVKLRYRIDGILYDIKSYSKGLQNTIVSRIKIMAHLNIAEKRLPQDGKINFDIAGKHIDMRISVLPTNYGESIVIRILDKDSVILGLNQLGLLPDSLAEIYNLIAHSHGLILVSGPTGSGKTTTLYSALSQLNGPEKKIITIEDPIEYEIPNIQQIQVKPKIGLTFAAGLRSILRHDPDIILVGEIRDSETAKIAIQSALTGHFVFSTVHTNDSAGAVIRLIDMGIENFLIASSVIGVAAQRLVRIICNNCKTEFMPDEKTIQNIQRKSVSKKIVKHFYRGAGCAYCKNTGYRGRTGIFELMPVNDDVRRLICKSSSAAEIRDTAVKFGMTTLFDYGLQKVEDGVTTIAEVLRVCAM